MSLAFQDKLSSVDKLSKIHELLVFNWHIHDEIKFSKSGSFFGNKSGHNFWKKCCQVVRQEEVFSSQHF